MSTIAETAAVERLADEAHAWFRVAVALEAENRQVRDWLVTLLIWVVEREDLMAFARAEIAKRWPDSEHAR